MRVFLDHIQVELGDVRRDVAAAHAAGALVSGVDELITAGFRTHHVCSPETTAYDLARRAVAPIVAAGHRRFGALVYATTLPGNAAIGDGAEFARTGDVKSLMRYPAARLQAEFGFDEAFVIGLGQQACTGIAGTLRVARALLCAEPDLDPILCLTADRFPPGAGYEQAYNLVSDGAVACVVSREPTALELLAVHHRTDGALASAGDDQTVASYFPATCDTIEQACAAAGIRTDDLAWVVTQNTHTAAAGILARLLGVPAQRMYQRTLPEVGHLIAGDALVNLVDLRASGLLRAGDLVALTMAGYGLNWQCVVLRVCAPASVEC